MCFLEGRPTANCHSKIYQININLLSDKHAHMINHILSSSTIKFRLLLSSAVLNRYMMSFKLISTDNMGGKYFTSQGLDAALEATDTHLTLNDRGDLSVTLV